MENNKILLKDAVGKTILEQKIPNNRAELDINTMSLRNGVYFVMIVNQNAVLEVKKIEINH
ncbi:MAG: T9SS type A sorting domain-containing protein [Bacteroidia bacterium]|nr:T9SS type A sorting domain-containing protein [Bacteroidia bacterium]